MSTTVLNSILLELAYFVLARILILNVVFIFVGIGKYLYFEKNIIHYFPY